MVRLKVYCRFLIFPRKARSRFVPREIKENERAKFGNRQHVGTAIVIHVRNDHLYADARFTIDQIWFEMRGPSVTDQPKPIEDWLRHRFDITFRSVRPTTFADNDVRQAIAVQVCDGQRVRLSEGNAMF